MGLRAWMLGAGMALGLVSASVAAPVVRVELPDLRDGEGDTLADNIRATSALWLAGLIEDMASDGAVERLVGLFGEGLLPLRPVAPVDCARVICGHVALFDLILPPTGEALARLDGGRLELAFGDAAPEVFALRGPPLALAPVVTVTAPAVAPLLLLLAAGVVAATRQPQTLKRKRITSPSATT